MPADQAPARNKHAVIDVSFEAIQEAAARLRGRVERTPIRRSRTLSDITGADVWLKFENLQFIAAFKERDRKSVV